MSENLNNILKVNANIEINDKNFLLFPVSQINVRFSVECTSFNFCKQRATVVLDT